MGSSCGHDLPFALVEDILLRLPVESWVRFSSVCKSWSALFQEPSFISRQSNHNMLLLCVRSSPYCHKLFSLRSEKGDAAFSLKQISIPMNLRIKDLSYHRVSNPCNGIMCLYSDYFCCPRDVALCNPATRQVRLLPPSDLIPKINNGMVIGVGMGYDPTTKDYKVVRMWNCYDDCCRRFIIEEYALSTDSWSTIASFSGFGYEFDACCFAMHFNGVYYWWAKQQGSTTAVLALNMGGGDFHKVILPNPIDVSSAFGRYLGVWNDALSLVCRNCCDNNCLDIWVMDGIGAKGSSWTKLRTINQKWCRPLVFWKGNQLLIEMFDKLGSYNIDTQEIQNVNIELEGQRIFGIREAIIYVKSLVSIN